MKEIFFKIVSAYKIDLSRKPIHAFCMAIIAVETLIYTVVFPIVSGERMKDYNLDLLVASFVVIGFIGWIEKVNSEEQDKKRTMIESWEDTIESMSDEEIETLYLSRGFNINRALRYVLKKLPPENH
jgi:hypothetical protein